MSMGHFAQVISFFAGVAALMGVVSLLHSQSVDKVRSDLFALRDEMFLYAVDHSLLDEDAYKNLRGLMNGFIRYAHRLTATHVILMTAASHLLHRERKSFFREWKALVQNLPTECQADMRSFYFKNEMIVASYLVKRSILLSSCAHIINFAVNARRSKNAPKDSVVDAILDRAAWQTIEAEAKAA